MYTIEAYTINLVILNVVVEKYRDEGKLVSILLFIRIQRLLSEHFFLNLWFVSIFGKFGFFFYFRCIECQRVYSSQSSLNDHIKQHTSTFHRLYCEKCPKSFLKESSLKNHLRYGHTADADKIYACNICPKK